MINKNCINCIKCNNCIFCNINCNSDFDFDYDIKCNGYKNEEMRKNKYFCSGYPYRFIAKPNPIYDTTFSKHHFGNMYNKYIDINSYRGLNTKTTLHTENIIANPIYDTFSCNNHPSLNIETILHNENKPHIKLKNSLNTKTRL